ncbi:MAG: hypothetical protein JXK94_05290 [Deltaproteobacteria bacterium]|nr:hypothetical protein [Deltaproteobacteria bacterium]
MKGPARIPILFFMVLFLGTPLRLPALEIFSVSPVKVFPGQVVQVTGGPFYAGVKVVIGDAEVVPQSFDEKELSFKVPELGEGEYILFLRSGEENSPVFRLEITVKPPIVYSVNPLEVDECEMGLLEKDIELQGDHFQRGAIVLLDGKVVPSARRSARLITMPVGDIKGGNHELQVVNPDGRQSLSQGFVVNDQPEIFSVIPGEDHVNSYELIIEGKNFVQNSQLLIDGRSILAVSGIPAQTDIVRYVDCHTLIYVRYPYSRELKQVSIRIVNPNGKQTPLFTIAAP